MNFFSKLIYEARKLLTGRNGFDQFNYALLIAMFVISIVNSFFGRLLHLQSLLDILRLVFLFLFLFRFFSKDIAKRQKENVKFQELFIRSKSEIKSFSNRMNDKDHKYIRCENCATQLRVPKGKGKIKVTCPKCGKEIFTKS